MTLKWSGLGVNDMDVLYWLTGNNEVPGTARDLRWAWVTVLLSALVVAAYAAIAFNRYFQSKLARPEKSKAAGARLRNIVLACAACGYVFYATGMGWWLWRLYDLALLLVAAYGWSFVLRTRGLGLVDEQLARVGELERSVQRYRQMAELLPHIVWTATDDGHVDFANRRWIEYSGGGGTWLDAVHPDERQEVGRWWKSAVAARAGVSREVRLGGLRGYRTFLLTADPVFMGDSVKWLGALADIEGPKSRAERKERRAARKTLFLNALSHDLRAPLNVVTLNAHMLKTAARDEVEVESAKLIIENATAAGNMVNRALELAKAEAEERNVVELVRVEQVLRQVVRRFAPAAQQKGLYLRVEAAQAEEIRTDRTKLERVVTNLVDNAIKFTDRGGVTLGLAAGEDAVTVRVCDTGPGVAPETAARLFDEFYQAAGATAGGAGYGMGLAICRLLARQLGGDVRLTATGPGGSCFEVSVKRECPDVEEEVGAAAGDRGADTSVPEFDRT